jgi:hypothetical protein
MNQKELLESIRSDHRQLERYIFYFEKNRQGLFVASERTKFGRAEMLQPGVFLEWSLKDLLCHLIDWEGRFLEWYRAGLNDEAQGDLPPADLIWADIVPEDYPIPMHIRNLPMEEVLREFKRSFQHIMSVAESIPEDGLTTPGYYEWTGEAALEDYLILATSRHYAWAKNLIRRWRGTHAGKYLNKQVILDRIHTERRRLMQNLSGLTREEMQVGGVVGVWSSTDLLAHLSAWEQLFLGWYTAGLRGENPEVPAPGIGWEDLDILNQQIYEKNRDRSFEDVQDSFDESFKQVLETVAGIPEEEMFTVGRYSWLGEANLAAYILANTANHYRWAKEKVRSWSSE